MKFFYRLCLVPALAFSGQLFAQVPCGAVFYDGFESGSYAPAWTVGSASTVWSVTATNPASGTYRLEGTGADNTHMTGLSTTFASCTPSTISWDMYPNGTGACNYVVGGDNAVTPTNCVFFCYYTSSTNGIRFVSGSTVQYTVPVINTWYHVEMRNINWSAHTFDIYIDNNLITTGFAFRSSSENSLTNLNLYNYTSGTFGAWDNINVGGTFITANSFSSSVSCNGGSDGGVSLNVSGGTPAYSYSWSTGATTQNVSGLTAGTYSVVITDAGGCHDTLSSISVTEPTPVMSTASVSDVQCNGGGNGGIDQAPGGGTPGYTFMWSDGSITEDIAALAAGTYSVTVTDMNGCTGTATYVVTEPPAITTSVSSTGVLCNGGSDGSASITPSGGTPGYTYAWNTGDVTQNISNEPAGTYSCSVTDANGCQATGLVTITEPAALSMMLSFSQVTCNGLSDGSVTANVSGGTPSYTYNWSNGGTAQSISSLSPGTYVCTLSDMNGCSGLDSVTITEPSALALALSSLDVTCPGGTNGAASVAVAGGTPGYTMMWSNSATTDTTMNLSAGVYSVNVTDMNGCTAADSVSISAPAPFSLTAATSDPTTCAGNDGTIDLTVSGGTPGYSFSWSNSAATEDLYFLSAGTYSVDVTDTNGCTSGASFLLNDPAPPVVTLSLPGATHCVNDAPFALTGGSPAGGTWSGTGVSGSNFNPSVSGTGSFVVTYTYTAPTGCSASATDTVTVSSCTGIDEMPADQLISVYPNPTNGNVALNCNNISGEITAEIINPLGQVIEARTFTGNRLDFDLSAQPAGVYLVRVRTSQGTVAKKVVKQ
ncbi:MAG TPA: T9SS type A sorting domain-containing protein [Bacteroidia bacterium]|nr:T9SS type A sorting domain-containing protein [Bacteroidia bacterium]